MVTKNLCMDEMLNIQTNINFKNNPLFLEADYKNTQKKLFEKSHKTLKKYKNDYK